MSNIMRNVSLSVSGITAIGIEKGLFVGVGDRNVVCGAGAKAIGVTSDAVSAGEQFAISVLGVEMVRLAATIAADKPVTSDADGKAVEVADVAVAIPADSTPVTSDAAQPDLVVSGGKLPVQVNGWLLEGGDAGDLRPVLLV